MYCLDDESFERMSEEKDIECKRWISPNFHIETTSEFHQKGWDALMWNKMEPYISCCLPDTMFFMLIPTLTF